MYDLPTQFSAHAHATQKDILWTSTSTEEFSVGIPPVFGGDTQCTSPEDFLVLALANCYVATFKTIAKKSSVHFEKMFVHCTLDIDKTNNGIEVVGAHTTVTIHTQEKEKAQSVAKVAHDRCIIHNAVQFDTHITVEFEE